MSKKDAQTLKIHCGFIADSSLSGFLCPAEQQRMKEMAYA
jgi:hypothetical protein